MERLMVKKFDEFVGEGFLSKTLGRTKSGESRIEDRLPKNNLKNLKPVDLGLPFLIADDDLKLNNEDYFNLNDIEMYLGNIEKTGWRLPTTDEIKLMRDLPSKIYDNRLVLYSGDRKSHVILLNHFFISAPNWKEDDYIGTVIIRKEEPDVNYMRMGPYLSGFKYTIRLVKDKNVNEGFLSKTLGRAKSGEQRLEDKLPPNNLKDLKPVDLGLSFLIADDVLTIDTEKIRREKFFKKEDVFKYVDNIEKTGWRLPSVKEVEELQKFKNVEYTADFTHIDFIGDNSKLSFNFMIHDFFIHDEKQVYDGDNGIGRVQFSKFYDKQNFMKICGCVDTEYCTFRLIKDKR